ncbi:MAG TPA: carboxypeptidase-like regulatory domain-containing protein, partial [Candidatus Thermoplasmatota archaeon]|nr:carboxypeptidase-like regulatory domain-containing protein [Candidatus Thermoplasmatota archaeon]
DVLWKGVGRVLLGKVEHRLPSGACSEVGVANLPVEVRLGEPPNVPQLFGLALTRSDGSFELPVNLTVAHAAGPIPAGCSCVLRGVTAGMVEWQADPSAVAVEGTHILRVSTYATKDLASASTTVDNVRVQSSQRVVFLNAPNSLTPGQEEVIRVRLMDDGGTSLGSGKRVTVALGGRAEVSGLSNQQGIVQLDLRVPAPFPAGATALTATCACGSPPLQASHTVTVRLPTTIAEVILPDHGDAGQPVAISGRVRLLDGSEGVPGVRVSARVQAASDATQAVTDSNGRFHVTVKLHENARAGQYGVVVVAEQGSTSLESRRDDRKLAVRGFTQWIDIDDSTIQAIPLPLRARLVEADGATGVPNVPVRVLLGGIEATGRTEATGRLNLTFRHSLPPQPALLRLLFAGDALHAPAEAQVERDVASTTLLHLPDGVVPRGGPARILLRLTDGGGPVANAPLAVAWGSEPSQVLLTGTDGTATFVRPGSLDDALGSVTVRASYAGSADGARAASRVTATWTVASLAEVLLPSGNATAGEPVPAGLVRDAGSLHPIVRVRISLRVQDPAGAVTWSNVTSDAEGRFGVLPAFEPTAPPRTLQLAAWLHATAPYPATQAQATLAVRSAVALTPQVPEAMVAGRETLLAARLVDARGLPVPGGTLAALLGTAQVGAAEVRDGAATVRVTLPEATQPGSTSLRLAFLG